MWKSIPRSSGARSVCTKVGGPFGGATKFYFFIIKKSEYFFAEKGDEKKGVYGQTTINLISFSGFFSLWSISYLLVFAWAYRAYYWLVMKYLKLLYTSLVFYLSWPDKWMSLLIFKNFTQISKTGLTYFVITVLNKPWTRKRIKRKEKNIKLVHHLLSRIQIRKPKDLEVFLKW